MIRIKRVYDPAEPEDGARFLVDRLWPRGLSRKTLKMEAWLKDVAPSDALRRRFHHDPERWAEFRRLYFDELDADPEARQPILDAAQRGDVTLLYAARDTSRNNAAALKEYLETRKGRPSRGSSKR